VWQNVLEFYSMSAGHAYPISFFVDAGGSLRACGVELQEDDATGGFLDGCQGASAGHLGFGSDWGVKSGSAFMRKEEPTLVPAANGVRMRSVAVGADHVLALTEEGQVYMWRSNYITPPAPQLPTSFAEVSELKVRRVATGAWHSTVLTVDGKLYMWWDSIFALQGEQGGAAGAGYPSPDRADLEGALCRPRCVEGALAGMRIVSVAAGKQYNIVSTDQGVAPHVLSQVAFATWVSLQALAS
jgi:hypothetical protein